MKAIDPKVYASVGAVEGGLLPSYTSIGCYTLLYQTSKGESVCGWCATAYQNDRDPIIHVTTYDEGEVLSCACCQEEIEPSYHTPSCS
jgi:hypothetical protein